jgi:DNA-directed RNA polymerase specialized sigma24 family protein
MGRPDMFCVSAYDSDPCVEELLEYFDPYIVAQVEVRAYRSTNIAHPEVLDLEIDEIIQKVRIKFWRALLEKNIRSPRAYIRRMVHNEFIDVTRSHEPPLPLPVGEDGELYLGNVIVLPSEGMSDPACEIEQKEAADARMAEAATIVSRLPPRQQRATICSLKDRVDDLLHFVEALSRHEIDVEVEQWPAEKDDLQRLKASVSPARQKIAQFMDVDLAQYK